MGRIIRQSIVMLGVLTVLTGIVYPLVVTGLAQVIFPRAANGSLLVRDGKPIASELIGQVFTDPKYFWSRPSATSPFPDNSTSSSGSNLGPTNSALTDAVKQRIEALRAADPGNTEPVPVDLITASGSGLDPHISPAAAIYQMARVVRVRGISPEQVKAMIAQASAGRQLGLLGEPRVNVLQLNLLLDGR
jgi:K+-transporting ATPase ATPase C chain